MDAITANMDAITANMDVFSYTDAIAAIWTPIKVQIKYIDAIYG